MNYNNHTIIMRSVFEHIRMNHHHHGERNHHNLEQQQQLIEQQQQLRQEEQQQQQRIEQQQLRQEEQQQERQPHDDDDDLRAEAQEQFDDQQHQQQNQHNVDDEQQQLHHDVVVRNHNRNVIENNYHPIWNAIDFIEKLIPWWCNNSHQQRSKNLSLRPCPAVTFFFEKEKCITVAVLLGYHQDATAKFNDDNENSMCDNNSIIPVKGDRRKVMTNCVLSEYFRHRVHQGTAIERSLLYYELQGYVRPNYTQFCNHMKRLCVLVGTTKLFDVTIAQGSLDASDQMQVHDLNQKRLVKFARYHPKIYSHNNIHNNKTEEKHIDHTYTADYDTLDASKKSSGIEEEKKNTNIAKELDNNISNMIETALEIARIHRLQDDLDILSIYCMRHTYNKVFGKIACRMARNYMMSSIDLSITPLVDGVLLSDYSTFVRQNERRIQNHDNDVTQQSITRSATRIDHENNNIQKVFTYHNESGNVIQYQEYPDVQLMNKQLLLVETNQEDYLEKEENHLHDYCTFVPTNSENVNGKDNNCCFTWNCEEFILPNMHCRSLLRRDYQGQKLVVKWYPKLNDIHNEQHIIIGSKPITLASVRIDTNRNDTNRIICIPFDHRKYNSDKGISNKTNSIISSFMEKSSNHNNCIPIPGITLFVHESNTIVHDKYNFNVTTLHYGRIEIQSICIDFTCFIRAIAKYYVVRLKREYQEIENYRPILKHEKEYLQFIQNLVI